MEGKNVVYLVALVVTCLFVILIVSYMPNLRNAFPNADQSSNLIDHIENNIDSDNSNDSMMSSSVYKKNEIKTTAREPITKIYRPNIVTKPISEQVIAPSENPIDLSQINEKLNNHKEPVENPDAIAAALKSLVAPRYTGTNEHVIDDSLPVIEFNVPDNQRIEQYYKDPSKKDFRYEITYSFGGGHSKINLVDNNTVFQESLASKGVIGINYRYSEDKNQDDRMNMLKYSRSESERQDILKRLPVKVSLEQSVNFFMWNITFNKALKMPRKLTIWNENSSDIFPCYLSEHSFPHVGTSYNVDYVCEKLPNFNDYGGTLKFIFN